MKRIVLPSLVILLLTWTVTFAQENRNTRSDNRLPGIFRGIELSDAQHKQVKSITARFRQKLSQLTTDRNAVFTKDQQSARLAAIRKGREQGKTNEDLRIMANSTIDLSSEQMDRIVAIENRRREVQKSMQLAFSEVLTPQQKQKTAAGKRPNQDRRAARIPPTHANVMYGPHERNVLDIWLAKSDNPTPVFFSIHGGGFRGGNKGVDTGLLKACLEKGISVVAITYRLSQDAIAPAPFHDSARAVQFIRSKAEEWNLDKTRFASSGGSAGAGISLWLAFHPDLEDQDNSDPILQESTRLKCAIVFNGQTTYDPREIQKLIPEAETFRHSALVQLYDVDLSKGLENIAQEKLKLFEECSPMTHLSKTDPPVLLAYATNLETKITSQGIGIHHPRFGELLKKKMDGLAIECIVSTNSKRGSAEWIQETINFLEKHLVSDQ